MENTDDLLSRQRFLKLMGISSSGEIRGRTGGGSWPPHVRVGHKVYYRRESVEQWILEQERTAEEHRRG